MPPLPDIFPGPPESPRYLPTVIDEGESASSANSSAEDIETEESYEQSFIDDEYVPSDVTSSESEVLVEVPASFLYERATHSAIVAV